MADQTVRTIYEANVTRAQRNLTDLSRTTDRAADSVDKLDRGLDAAGKRDVNPQIDIDIRKAEAEVRKLTGTLDKLEKSDANVEINAEADQARRAIDILTSELSVLESAPAVAVVDADIAKAQTKAATLRRELDVLSRLDPSLEVSADTAKAENALEDVEARLDALGSIRAEAVATVEADTATAQAALDDAEQRLREIDGRRAEAVVTADIGAAASDLAAAEADLRALQGAKAEMVVTVDADDSFEDMGDAAQDAGSDAGARAGSAILEGLNSTPVVGAISGLVAAVGGYISVGIIDAVLQSVRDQDVFGARTGLDEATARKFGAAAGLAYTNAWGDSIEANMGTAQSALENALVLPDSTGREIQGVIEQLSAVSELLDVDVSEAAEAAGNMIKNGLAADAEEAFDIIVTGAQNGMNRSDDLLDTLREYSGMFESIGLDGAEALGLIDQAMEAGARNSDVAADALKEFSIRAQDDSKTTREAYETIGLSADEMGEKIAKGGDDAREGLDMVLDGLRDIEDPVQQNLAGVALFGTMWEDMANGAGVLAMDLDNLSDSWVNVGDTTADAMQRMSDNSATALETAKRTIENAATNLLGGIAVALEEPIADAAGYVNDNTAEIIGFLIEVGEAFFDVARAAVEFAAQTVEALGDVAGGVNGIIDGIGAAVEAIGVATGDMELAGLGQDIQDAAGDMQEFADNSDGMADTIRNTALPAIDEAEQKFKDFSGPVEMQARLNDAINGMVGELDGFVSYVDGLPGGTITINGDTTEGEEAMNTLIAEVAESNGTLTINGETVPVEDALDHVKDLAAEGAEISFTANTDPVESSLDGIMTEPPTVEVPVTADTGPAALQFEGLVSDVPPAMIDVIANTEQSESKVKQLEVAIDNAGGTVEINGSSYPADAALAAILGTIDQSDGTVTINGEDYPVRNALGETIMAINRSDGTITIKGDNDAANAATNSAVGHANRSSGTIKVNASTSAANSAINDAARDRWSTIRVSYSVVGGVPQARFGNGTIASGRALGGRIDGMSGYESGYGIVPGPSAPYGVDNVLWPDLSGAPAKGYATGGMLNRPLAGGEWVVNPISSKQHDSLLSAINAGATRSQIAEMVGGAGGGAGIDFNALMGAVSSGARAGVESATVIAQVSDRVAANLYQRGASASRAYGGKK